MNEMYIHGVVSVTITDMEVNPKDGVPFHALNFLFSTADGPTFRAIAVCPQKVDPQYSPKPDDADGWDCGK